MIRKLILGIWLLALVGATAWLIWRQRELRARQNITALLRKQVAAQSEPVVGQASATGLPANAVGPLTPEEQRELLVLRGQVAQLLRELSATSSREPQLAEENQPSPNKPENDYQHALDESARALATVLSPQLILAATEVSHLIIQHAESNGGRVPASLSELNATSLSTESSALLNRLELLPGEAITPETDCCIFTAREHEARQTADGKWVRLYLLANGRFSIAGPVDNPNWPHWERHQLGMLKEAARRRMQPP